MTITTSPTNELALGDARFRRADRPVAPATLKFAVRVHLRAGVVRCNDGTHAVRLATQDRMALTPESIAALPATYGLVADDQGAVTHQFARNGLLYPLKPIAGTGVLEELFPAIESGTRRI